MILEVLDYDPYTLPISHVVGYAEFLREFVLVKDEHISYSLYHSHTAS